MQTPKARTGSSEVSQKVSPRGVVRQLRPAALYIDSASTLNQVNRTTSKDRSPKVIDRRSPRSPAPERKRPSRILELESQVSQLREDLKKLREQLSLSESCKKQAQQEAVESKQQLFALSVKLEESQQQLLKLSASEESHLIELQKISSQEHERAWKSKLEAAQKHLSLNSQALTSSMNDIQQLKAQLELVANCANAQTQLAESSDLELLNLKQNLEESFCLVNNMKNQIGDCKQSSQAQAWVSETLQQLEAAKRTVEFLRADVAKAVHGHNSCASELDQSIIRLNSLEAHVSQLAAGLINNSEQEAERLEKGESPNHIEAEICFLKSEVERLRCGMEVAETKYHEEQIRSTVQIRNAYELIEQIKSESSRRESELGAELRRKKADIEELKANLMDKETELQCIAEENERLNMKLEKILLSQREHEHELKRELERLNVNVAELKADMMDKETTLQSISEENEMLKMEINKKSSSHGGKLSEEVNAEVEAAKAAEREAVMRLGIVMEEADRSNRKVARVAEQLEAAQAANSEIEAELRRLKVQSDQWRKAAETAAAVLSAGKGKLSERSLSLDNNYNKPLMNKYSPYCEDITDDDFQRKKNGNMLKKIGVLWKKPQKVTV